MPLFVGRQEVKLDPKGRLVLPAQVRALLGERAYLTKGTSACVVVMPEASFEQRAEQLEAQYDRGEITEQVVRTFFAAASLVTPDAQGRVLVQPELRSYAGITDQVVVAGRGRWVELWDARRWEEIQAAGDSQLAGSR